MNPVVLSAKGSWTCLKCSEKPHQKVFDDIESAVNEASDAETEEIK
jgi:hypothetical protein